MDLVWSDEMHMEMASEASGTLKPDTERARTLTSSAVGSSPYGTGGWNGWDKICANEGEHDERAKRSHGSMQIEYVYPASRIMHNSEEKESKLDAIVATRIE